MLCLAVCQELISQRFINSLQPVNDFSAATLQLNEGKEEKSVYTLSHLISSLDPLSSSVSAEGKRGITAIAKLPAATYIH